MKRLGLALLSILVLGFALAQAQQATIPTGMGTVVCAYNSSLPTITTANFGYVQCDANGRLIVATAAGTSTTFTALCTGQIKATATACSTAAAHVAAVYDFGNAANTVASYIQIFDVAVGSVVLGTTTPRYSFELPAGGGRVVSIPGGEAYATQLTIACTTTATGLTAPTNNCSYNVIGR